MIVPEKKEHVNLVLWSCIVELNGVTRYVVPSQTSKQLATIDQGYPAKLRLIGNFRLEYEHE